VRLFQFPSLKTPEALEACARSTWTWGHGLRAAVRAARVHRHSTPRDDSISPLPAAQISRSEFDQLAIIHGDTLTGLTISVRATTDEGPVILQKETPIGRTTRWAASISTGCSRWRAAMTEAADLVMSATPKKSCRTNRRQATRAGAAIRRPRSTGTPHRPGLQPDPRLHSGTGAWTTVNGKKLRILEARKLPRAPFRGEGKIGAVTDIGARSILVSTQGGQIEVLTLRPDDGKKLSGRSFAHKRV